MKNYEKSIDDGFSDKDKDIEDCSENEQDDNVETEETDDTKKSPDEADSNDFNAHTCLYPREPASNIIVNHSNKKKVIRKKRKGGKVYDYAPGQEFCPTNWIREKNHDEIAFPELYTTGTGGINDESRIVKISKPDFCSQKFCNHNKIYAKNSEYLFVCQQHLERHLLENNINVTLQKGKPEKGPDGTTILSCNNAFDVFSKIPGTPSYWKNFRNELFARMEQLGPFHFFFTLSAAEMLWREVSTSILHSQGCIDRIIYQKGWEYDEKLILVVDKDGNEMSLPEYLKKEVHSKHKFYKDEFLLITRIFDNRVKAFITHILMANKDVEHYSYRIGK